MPAVKSIMYPAKVFRNSIYYCTAAVPKLLIKLTNETPQASHINVDRCEGRTVLCGGVGSKLAKSTLLKVSSNETYYYCINGKQKYHKGTLKQHRRCQQTHTPNSHTVKKKTKTNIPNPLQKRATHVYGALDTLYSCTWQKMQIN